jgi:uncharacterized protein YbjT (DUF2867 family)
MFTVLGITGKVGGAVAENLLAAGKTVRGVVRDSGKAKAWADRGVELVQSAYDDAAGLAKAFSGAEGVFAMASTRAGSTSVIREQRSSMGRRRSRHSHRNSSSKEGRSGPVVPRRFR